MPTWAITWKQLDLNYGASYNYVKNNNKQSNVDKQHDNEAAIQAPSLQKNIQEIFMPVPKNLSMKENCR